MGGSPGRIASGGRALQDTAWSDVSEQTGAAARHTGEAVEVALAQSGDTGAFERLYQLHVARVHSLARRMVPDADPDELTQDVFVRAWQKLEGFRGEAAFGTWLHRLAVNRMLEARGQKARARARYANQEQMPDLPGRRETPDEAMDLQEATARLPAGMRQVFVLHDMEGYRHEEIGEMLGISAGTSKSQLHRARMALRASLRR
jgi:RNA polymerase sigma-70 factor (ECF subfamily)